MGTLITMSQGSPERGHMPTSGLVANTVESDLEEDVAGAEGLVGAQGFTNSPRGGIPSHLHLPWQDCLRHSDGAVCHDVGWNSGDLTPSGHVAG